MVATLTALAGQAGDIGCREPPGSASHLKWSLVVWPKLCPPAPEIHMLKF